MGINLKEFCNIIFKGGVGYEDGDRELYDKECEKYGFRNMRSYICGMKAKLDKHLNDWKKGEGVSSCCKANLLSLDGEDGIFICGCCDKVTDRSLFINNEKIKEYNLKYNIKSFSCGGPAISVKDTLEEAVEFIKNSGRSDLLILGVAHRKSNNSEYREVLATQCRTNKFRYTVQLTLKQ